MFAQVKAFFPAFHECLARQRDARAHCDCDACTGIDHLALQAFVHVGELAIKQVRQFEELAGEEVILVHRLLKNHVPSRQYVLFAEAARSAAGLPAESLQAHQGELEGIGEARLWLIAPAAIPYQLPQPPPATLLRRLQHWLRGASSR